jgi:hypothetical protein
MPPEPATGSVLLSGSLALKLSGDGGAKGEAVVRHTVCACIPERVKSTMFFMGTPDVPFLIFRYQHKAHAAARSADAVRERFSTLDYASVPSNILSHFARFLFPMIPERACRCTVIPVIPHRLAGISAPVNEYLHL